MSKNEEYRTRYRRKGRRAIAVCVIIILLFALYFAFAAPLPSSGLNAGKMLVTVALAVLTVCLYAAGVVILLFNVWDWYASLRFIDPSWLQTCRRMAQIRELRNRDKSRSYRDIFLGCATALVCFSFWLNNHSHLLLAFAFFLICCVLSVPLWLTAPPTILFLAVSNEDTIILQGRIEDVKGLNTGGVASLLDLVRIKPFNLAYHFNTNSFRAYNKDVAILPDGWTQIVFPLMEITPIIVLDARTRSPAVEIEVARLIQSNWISKTFFVIGDHGEHPALDAVVCEADWRIVRESMITEERLLKRLQQLVQEPQTVRKPPWTELAGISRAQNELRERKGEGSQTLERREPRC